MASWQLKLADQQTLITVGMALSEKLADILPELSGHRVLLLTDDHVAPLHLARVKQQLETLAAVTPVIVSAGEATKNLNEVEKLYQILVDNQFNRTDYLVALGGGVIGDLGALVASTYMRGISLIQLPTTVVAQSDSSIGGKTAVDFSRLKNLIGTFYPAQKVIVDPKFLQTLPQHELAAGLVEVIKSLLISAHQPEDANLLHELETELKAHSQLPLSLLSVLVTRGLQIKSNLVTQDFYDFKERRYLNFGHTIGHAVEALADGQLRHGEAVSIGMVAMMTALVAHHELSQSVLDLTRSILKQLEVPTEIPSTFSHQAILAKTKLDKKANDQGIELVLLHDIGQPALKRVALTDFQDWLGWS
ncbi:3-dehydroquinate synthase [Lapidilactobacillus mulanensis]|uniref:3-dehydroquinate synthase n=1 Tax=Lapidilactobacillus mulanensis TaxID=2485999 RepID=A0ABW4DQY1_9LACO|nr:3-dehydroquinate synthase [Lapidilactobacillus mulanensis]